MVALQSELDKTMPGTRGSNEKSGSGLPKMRLASPALDFLVETAVTLPGCDGARLTGGGWGGATVNLVHTDQLESFQSELASRFEHTWGRITQTFTCAIADGARMVPVGGAG